MMEKKYTFKHPVKAARSLCCMAGRQVIWNGFLFSLNLRRNTALCDGMRVAMAATT